MGERDDYDDFGARPERWPKLCEWAVIIGGTVFVLIAVGMTVRIVAHL